MKRISALLALTLAAGFAYADDMSAYPNAAQAPSVQAALSPDNGVVAVAVGEAAAYPAVVAQGTPLTRAEVAADVERARAAGVLSINEAGLPSGAPTGSVSVFARRAGRTAL